MRGRETHPTPEAAAADLPQCPLCAGPVKHYLEDGRDYGNEIHVSASCDACEARFMAGIAPARPSKAD